ncbi:hypothetical protein C0J52_04941 [Blattella germanica]|nr:hypothetical protein C0J52_04941 [Blattella germanica]
MEQLIPSEVARLVYGYLKDNGCNNTAQTFLEESCHLAECLSLHREGKKLKTKVDGYSLVRLLDEYCEARNLVSERLQKFPESNVENLRRTGSLLAQLKFLFDATKPGDTLLLSITVPPQGSSGQISSSNILSNRPRAGKLPTYAERAKRSAAAHVQQPRDSDDPTPGCSNSIQRVEATPLESLPGLTQDVDEQGHDAGFTSRGECHQKEVRKQASSSARLPDTGRSEPSCSRTNSVVKNHGEGLHTPTSTPKKKMVSSVKRKTTPTPAKLHKLQRSVSEESEACENFDIDMVVQAILDNKMHERIAEISNQVRSTPGHGEMQDAVMNVPSTSSVGVGVNSYEMGGAAAAAAAMVPTSLAACDNELNQVIKTIFNQTVQDPLFERILQELNPPGEQEMTPSPAEMQSEAEDPVPELISTETSGESSLKDAEEEIVAERPTTSEMAEKNIMEEDPHMSETKENNVDENKDVPLKQRLRSARQRKSDGGVAANPVTTPQKDKRKETSLSLEDQNAAAIQSIVDAMLTEQSPPKCASVSKGTNPGDVQQENAKSTIPSDAAQGNQICLNEESDFIILDDMTYMLGGGTSQTPQASTNAASANQIVTIMIPSLLPQTSVLQPHGLGTNSASVVGAVNTVISGPLQQMPKPQVSSKVIMCGNDGVISEFVNLPLQNSTNTSALISTPGTSRFVPIVPKGGEVVLSNPQKLGVSYQWPLDLETTSPFNPSLCTFSPHVWSTPLQVGPEIRQPVVVPPSNTLVNPKPGSSGLSKKVKSKSSANSKAALGMSTRSQDKNKVITLYSEDGGEVVEMPAPATEQPTSSGAALSLPKLMDSPQVKGNGEFRQEKLLGALKLKEAVSEKSKSSNESGSKCPTSPHRISLVNLSKNNVLAGSRRKDSPGEGTNYPESKNKLLQKLRGTPSCQSKTGRHSKRMSLSTPRRRPSYVRVLEFKTPPKSDLPVHRKSNTCPKSLANKQVSPQTSEKSTKLTERPRTSAGVRSSLFQSPDAENKVVATKIPPIATRSPAPQLTGDWDKVTGVGLIFGGISPDPLDLNSSVGEEAPAQEDADPVQNDTTATEEPQDKIDGKTLSTDCNGKQSTPREKEIVHPKFFGTISSKTWDTDLRSLAAANFEDAPRTTKKRTPRVAKPKINKDSYKKNTATTSKKKKSAKAIEDEAKRIEESLNAVQYPQLTNEENAELLSKDINSENKDSQEQVSEEKENEPIKETVDANVNEDVHNVDVETASKEAEQHENDPEDGDHSSATHPDAPAGCSVNIASNSKVIQSPTKLKATRRTLVGQSHNNDESEENLVTVVNCSGGKEGNKAEEVTTDNRQSVHNNESSQTIKASEKTQVQVSDLVKNKTDALVLDTPRKDIADSSPWKSALFSLPMTPRVISPNSIDTPLPKAVPGSCSLTMPGIETPSFPPTPQIVVTPQSKVEENNFPPCSSYYKPSVEHVSSPSPGPASLEKMLIEECHKLEERQHEGKRVDCGNVPPDKAEKGLSPEKANVQKSKLEEPSSLPEKNNDGKNEMKGGETGTSCSSSEKVKKVKRVVKKKHALKTKIKKMELPAKRRRKSNPASSGTDSEQEEAAGKPIAPRNKTRKRASKRFSDDLIRSHLEAARVELFGNHSPSDDYDFASSDHSDEDAAPSINHSSDGGSLKQILAAESEKGSEINKKKTVRFNDIPEEYIDLNIELEEKRRRTLAKLRDPKEAKKERRKIDGETLGTKRQRQRKPSQSQKTKLKQLTLSSEKDEPSSLSVEVDTIQKKEERQRRPSETQQRPQKEEPSLQDDQTTKVANKESCILPKTTQTTPTKKAETSPLKRSPHLSVEAIAERLTREKTATPLRQPQVQKHHCGENSSEEFGSLRLSSEDEDTRLEAQMAELHGGKNAVSSVVATPMPLQDVRKALEMTPVESATRLENYELDLDLSRTENASEEKAKTSRKRRRSAEIEKKTNKKLKVLMGSDVSPIKLSPEGRLIFPRVKSNILHNLLTSPKTSKKSPIKMRTSKKKTKQNREESKYNSEKDDEKKAEAMPKDCEYSTKPLYVERQLAANEFYVEIIYPDDGPKGNNFDFGDISRYKMTFNVDEDTDGQPQVVNYATSSFQELYVDLPGPAGDSRVAINPSELENDLYHTESKCSKKSSSSERPAFAKNHLPCTSKNRNHNRRHSERRRSPSPVSRNRRFSQNPRRSRSLDRFECDLPDHGRMDHRKQKSPLHRLYKEFERDRKRVSRKEGQSRLESTLGSGKRGTSDSSQGDTKVSSSIGRRSRQDSSLERRNSPVSFNRDSFCGKRYSSSKKKKLEHKDSSEKKARVPPLLESKRPLNDESHRSSPVQSESKDLKEKAKRKLDESLEEGELEDDNDDDDDDDDDDDTAADPTVNNSKSVTKERNASEQGLAEEDYLMTYALVGSDRIENSAGDETPTYSDQEISKLQLATRREQYTLVRQPVLLQKAECWKRTLIHISRSDKKVRSNDPKMLLKSLPLKYILDYIHGAEEGGEGSNLEADSSQTEVKQ